MIHKFQSILSRFNSKHILVIGDFILDIYINGQIKRISPEAPIPIVDVQTVNHQLGGAANTALNLRSLSAKVTFCSVIGKDDAGQKGLQLLAEAGLSTKGVFSSKHKTTQAKSRIMSEKHAVVRYDIGNLDAVDKETEDRILSFIKRNWQQCDALLIADYEKGLLTPSFIDFIQKLNEKSPKFIAVDSKRLEAFKSLSPSLVKPNFEEAQKILSISIPITKNRKDKLREYGKELWKKTNAELISLTLDSEGAIWFEKGVFKNHIDAPDISFPCVNGAGDTFISAASLALLSGASTKAAAEIACTAATIVIQKEGTAFCTHSELSLRFHAFKKLIHSNAQLAALAQQYKSEGKKIVFTNGCFDILHSGHIHFLQNAKLQADILIVGLNSDASVARLKGAGRPINNLNDRMEVLSAIGCVDHIVSFGMPEDDTAIAVIQCLKPDIFVKGEDYKIKQLIEGQVLANLNIPVRFLPINTTHSTSKLIHQIQQNHYSET